MIIISETQVLRNRVTAVPSWLFPETRLKSDVLFSIQIKNFNLFGMNSSWIEFLPSVPLKTFRSTVANLVVLSLFQTVSYLSWGVPNSATFLLNNLFSLLENFYIIEENSFLGHLCLSSRYRNGKWSYPENTFNRKERQAKYCYTTCIKILYITVL